MYLKDGREIIESDKYPGYYVDQSNGAWCDEDGNYVGGNSDDGDEPGKAKTAILDVPDYVYVAKGGTLYYPKPTVHATKRIRLEDADKQGYTPSRGYEKFVSGLYKEYLKKKSKKKSSKATKKPKK